MESRTRTAQSPAGHAAPPASTPESSGSQPPPRRLSDIPTLGPIRVRALQKAGLMSLRAVREAGIEKLIAVPGLSEVKARFILEFLSRFPDLPDSDAPSPPALPRLPEAASPGTSAEVVHRLVLELLSGPHSSEYRPRLLRGLCRLAYLSGQYPGQANGLSEKEAARVVRLFRRVFNTLSEVAQSADTPPGRREQEELAEDLDAVNAKLPRPEESSVRVSAPKRKASKRDT